MVGTVCWVSQPTDQPTVTHVCRGLSCIHFNMAPLRLVYWSTFYSLLVNCISVCAFLRVCVCVCVCVVEVSVMCNSWWCCIECVDILQEEVVIIWKRAFPACVCVLDN